MAAVTCVLGLLAAVSMARPGPAQLVHSADAADAPPQTSTTDLPVTTDAPSTTEAPTTTVAPPAVVPTSTTTTLVCRNSTDPRCGPFRWDPDPGPNQPLTVTITFTPQHPHAGEPVTFFVRAQDPDAALFWGVAEEYGDAPGTAIDGYMFESGGPQYCAEAKYGPWTPPPRVAGDETLGNPPAAGITHTYAAGTYTARFRFRSDSTACGLHHPYGSFGEASIQVVVRPADAPTTSTTVSGPR